MKKVKKYILLLTPVSLLILIVARLFPPVAEYVFARGIFRVFAIPIGFLTGLVPVSLAELLIFFLPILLLVLFFRFMFLMFRPGRKEVLKRWGLNAGAALSLLLFLFTILCGVNYYRYEFQTFCDFEVKEYTVDQLYELCVYLAEQSNETKAQVTEIDEHGVVELEDFSKVAGDAEEAFEKLKEEYPVFRFSTGRAKPVHASHWMSYTGIVGIYIPFTMEANVNTDVEDYNRPADTCHELAHLHGFMRENEANYISYLACIGSDEAYIQYSGYMMALIYATNALYEEDVQKYMEIAELLSEEVKADLRAEDVYWEEIRNSDAYETVEAVSDQVNNTYLKVNGQSDGVKSYGKMVDLLIADYLAR